MGINFYISFLPISCNGSNSRSNEVIFIINGILCEDAQNNNFAIFIVIVQPYSMTGKPHQTLGLSSLAKSIVYGHSQLYKMKLINV